MSKLFSELKRRNVFRAAAAYTLVAWVIAQAFDLAIDSFGAPDWVMKVILIILMAGLPITLIMAWAFELTPEGVKKSDEVPATDSITPRTGQALNRVTTTALILVLAFVAWDKLGPAEDASDNEIVDKSVAVLPFADLSELQNQEWFTDGLTEEILNSLARLPELRVTARTSSFEFKNQNTDISEIAASLGVAHIVEGSVRRIGDQLRVTAQLIRAHDGFHLWSNTYDSTTENLFDVQHDVAENIASTLNVILDDEKREYMFSSGTRNVAAFEAHQKGQDKFSLAHSRQDSETVSLADANAYFELAMELDPDYATPAIMHSDRYAHRLLEGQARIVGHGDELDEETAYQLMMADLDFAIRNAPDNLTRLVYEINREFFAPTWDRMPDLVRQIDAAVKDGVALPTITVWLPEVLMILGETELLEVFARNRLQVDPLNISPWLDIAEVLAMRGDFDGASQRLRDARQRFGTSTRLREMEVRLALLSGDKVLAIQLMEDGFDMSADYRYFQPVLLALQGKNDEALALATALTADVPVYSMTYVYTLLGDVEAARQEIARIDALVAGPTLVALDITQFRRLFWFNIDDAPRLKKRFQEARIDSARFTFNP